MYGHRCVMSVCTVRVKFAGGGGGEGCMCGVCVCMRVC